MRVEPWMYVWNLKAKKSEVSLCHNLGSAFYAQWHSQSMDQEFLKLKSIKMQFKAIKLLSETQSKVQKQ